MGPIYGYTAWGVIRHPAYCEHSKKGTTYEHNFATCTEPETKTYACYWCGIPTYTEILEEAHHTNISIYEAVEPSCSPGYTYGEYCYGCDTWIVEREEIPPIYEEHDWYGLDCSGIDRFGEDCAYCERSDKDHPGWSGESAATCTEDGYFYKYCWRCSQKIISTIIPATGHNYVDGFCINNPWPWSDYDYTCRAVDPATCNHDQGTHRGEEVICKICKATIDPTTCQHDRGTLVDGWGDVLCNRCFTILEGCKHDQGTWTGNYGNVYCKLCHRTVGKCKHDQGTWVDNHGEVRCLLCYLTVDE